MTTAIYTFMVFHTKSFSLTFCQEVIAYLKNNLSFHFFLCHRYFLLLSCLNFFLNHFLSQALVVVTLKILFFFLGHLALLKFGPFKFPRTLHSHCVTEYSTSCKVSHHLGVELGATPVSCCYCFSIALNPAHCVQENKHFSSLLQVHSPSHLLGHRPCTARENSIRVNAEPGVLFLFYVLGCRVLSSCHSLPRGCSGPVV